MILRAVILMLFLQSLFVSAQERLSLNGKWNFALAKTEQEAGNLAGFYIPGYSLAQFSQIPVPSNWAILGYEEPVYRGFKDDKASEGFYIHDFTIPQSFKDKRILLHFGGVWSSAEAWLNGTYLGRHDSGYTSFAFNITGKYKAGETNRLTVRVRQITPEYKFDTYDDWTLGGIYRDVTLETIPQDRWLDNVVVQTVFDSHFRDADLKIKTMVSNRHKSTVPGNYSAPGTPYDLRFTLMAKDGKEIAARQLTVPPHTATDRETAITLRVATPQQWTSETPYLYTLKVEMLEGGKVAHLRTEHVGFRQISTEGGIFKINGQAVKLRGVNRHDEYPDVGRATTREHWLKDLTLMKAANINYIRLSHYTPARGFIELCDELGMYVGNEVSMGGAENLMYDPSFSGAVLQRSYETVVRDINSPSVIYWSIGNEDPLTTLHMASVKAVKALDPTRPVLLPWRHEDWLPEEIDILAPHYWKPKEYDKLGGRATRPIITTEYTHAYGIDGFGGMESCWKALTKHASGAGGAIWMWADQGIITPTEKPDTYKNISPEDRHLRINYEGWDGIVDSYRNLTRDYFEVKAVYAQVSPAIEEVILKPGQALANIPIQNDFDFTDLSTIKISWAIYEDEKELASGNGNIKGQPHATSVFGLQLEKLKSFTAGKTYYVRFVFTNADGAEINRKTVELLPPAVPQTVVSNGKTVVTKGDRVIVETAAARYTFNPETGQLTSAESNGKQLITDIRPAIWRNIDASEATIPGGKTANSAADLNNYIPDVLQWDVKETDSAVLITAKVKYMVNDKNQYTVAYQYSIMPDGTLTVHYEILTEVEMPWLPMVGMSVRAVPQLNTINWLGLGPYDAYQNKHSAPILGVWGGIAGSKDITGNKSVRWIERKDKTGGFKIIADGYLKHDETNPDVITILSGVLGRPEKGRKADDSVPQLETNTGQPFVGEFTINLNKR